MSQVHMNSVGISNDIKSVETDTIRVDAQHHLSDDEFPVRSERYGLLSAAHASSSNANNAAASISAYSSSDARSRTNVGFIAFVVQGWGLATVDSRSSL